MLSGAIFSSAALKNFKVAKIQYGTISTVHSRLLRRGFGDWGFGAFIWILVARTIFQYFLQALIDSRRLWKSEVPAQKVYDGRRTSALNSLRISADASRRISLQPWSFCTIEAYIPVPSLLDAHLSISSTRYPTSRIWKFPLSKAWVSSTFLIIILDRLLEIQ